MRVPAAQYLRVSTEHQEYSLDFQASEIAAYALQHGFEVCKTYCDEAKSGLELTKRTGLSQLLRDVVDGQQVFKAVLVYDISRWGRFQNPDEAAHYEFLCKAAGVQVHYCAEQFSNNGGASATIMKAVKRVMAAEYSRELSQKTRAGLIRLTKRGFRAGSLPGYGLRRMLVSPNGIRKQQLSNGEHKYIATDRVILVPGPPDEVSCVREIYRMFIEGKSFARIASELEKRKIPFPGGKQWSHHAVKNLLTHPKYKGTLIYNKTTLQLCSRRRRLPQSQWISIENAFEPIVPADVFEKAQEVLRNKSWNRTDQEILQRLRSALKTHGYLSDAVLKPVGIGKHLLAYRFGSVIAAYELAGYESLHKKKREHRIQIKRLRDELISSLVSMFPQEISIRFGKRNLRNWLKVRNGPEVAVHVCWSQPSKKGRIWRLHPSRSEHCHLTLMAGMDPQNTRIEVLYLARRMTNRSNIHVAENSEWLQNAVPLMDLRGFCRVITSRSWR